MILARVIGFFVRLRFDSAKATGLDATLELRVRPLGRRRPIPLALTVSGGKCRLRPGPAQNATASATLLLGDMIRLALGLLGWPELLASGRLELAGDPFLALRFPALFRLPTVGSGAHGPA